MRYNDCMMAVSETENRVMIETGTGLTSQPLSLLNQVLTAHSFTALAAGLANATTGLFELMTAVGEDNSPRPYVWIMNDRTWLYLQSLRDANGVPGFIGHLVADQQEQSGQAVGTLYSHKVFVTNALSSTLGAGDETTIYLVSPSR